MPAESLSAPSVDCTALPQAYRAYYQDVIRSAVHDVVYLSMRRYGDDLRQYKER